MLGLCVESDRAHTAFAIHLLLILAIIALIAHFVSGRRSGRTRV